MLNHIGHFVGTNPILSWSLRDASAGRILSSVLAGIRGCAIRDYRAEGLHPDELATMLEMIGDQDAPDALIKVLSEATEGNPLFIREVLMNLLEEGKILADGKGWSSGFTVDELGIPEGVRQVIGRRLQRLSEDANRLLSVGSAFNGGFSFDIAAAVADLNEQAALSALDEALDSQLLRPGSTPETFDFTHALIRHTLYSDVNPARRTRLHRRIAEEMERAWGERVAHHAAEVAFQFWRGSSTAGTERGADYAIAAADNAEAAYAHDEVAAFLRIALELLPQTDVRRPRLLARLATALTCSLEGEEAGRAALEAAAAIARSEGVERAAEYCATMAREMMNAGLMDGAGALAREGLRHVGERRDIIWACLDDDSIALMRTRPIQVSVDTGALDFGVRF